MDKSTRLRYLEAMGIDVWLPKAAAFTAIAPVDVDRKPEAEALSWHQLEQDVSACVACELAQKHCPPFLGEGNQQADWMVVGLMPELNEANEVKAITGYAELLLNEMIRAIGLTRKLIYLTPVVKCLPVNNEEPVQAHADMCRDFLVKQIKLVQPKMILVLGQSAARFLLQNQLGLDQLRGQVHRLQNVPLIVVNHPENLLLSPLEKRAAWLDLQLALKTYQDGEQ